MTMQILYAILRIKSEFGFVLWTFDKKDKGDTIRM